ncbi:Site-specific recombinase XerD [Janthinobacterium sp. OK676]|uniref:site-specific integrase n=1 Tax=Janthinobacterium sp. OK676 TaxID=1855295 RepID=UPI00087ECED6|nr:site-specific integrase [Janthinobacterium sp. OK676]SDL47308.1 Site-specific recombinase XerD [Janthinobacterium sp. OK676]
MIEFQREVFDYNSQETGRNMRHHILTAHTRTNIILLSYPNLFLHDHATSSIETSNRYSSVLLMFYRYLSISEKFKNIDVSNYHAIVDNRDIKRWQVQRQIERVRSQNASPTSNTIFEDAKLLLVFFNWINKSGYITCVKINIKSWAANFKSEKMLNYVRQKSGLRIDSKNIEVLDKEKRQQSRKSLITDAEIKALILSFNDPVYSVMFKLALGTAMRPMDLCKFPYIGNGPNQHILPYSEMRSEGAVVSYLVTESKGKKDREIKINRADLKVLEDQYIRPFYNERARKYEKKYGRNCPPSILFLTVHGEPVTSNKVSSRTGAAKERAIRNFPEFRRSITFYDARHWWPTMYILKFFGDKLLTQSADALYLAAGEILVKQMGHEDLSTTYKYYVDMARLLMLAHDGHVHELVTDPDQTVEEFVEKMGAH